MTFTLLPAIDVADGQAVRLVQGKAGTETSHGAPIDAALAWQADGAEWIHLVDLDAAFRRGSNAEQLAAVIAKLDVKVQLSGGIDDDASLQQALSTGCERINLATTALKDLTWCTRAIAEHGEKIAIALDVRIVETADGNGHRLAARGAATDQSDTDLSDPDQGDPDQGDTDLSDTDQSDLWVTLARLDDVGCARYVVTDVSKDGMLHGPNVELYQAVTQATDAKVIASGGISSVDDLVMLAKTAATRSNLEGSIVGKALYAGRFTLPEALESMRQVTGKGS